MISGDKKTRMVNGTQKDKEINIYNAKQIYSHTAICKTAMKDLFSINGAGSLGSLYGKNT